MRSVTGVQKCALPLLLRFCTPTGVSQAEDGNRDNLEVLYNNVTEWKSVAQGKSVDPRGRRSNHNNKTKNKTDTIAN